uniref:Cytochrome P450 n=1 Tax=Megaselia scalaris TaxID=36166 RepID=T1GLJ0_MEGSC
MSGDLVIVGSDWGLGCHCTCLVWNLTIVWIGPEFNILTSDLKDVELILGGSKFNDKAEKYKDLEPWLNEGLLVSKGRKWFKRRKIITLAFHFKILEQYIETFDRQGKNLIKKLNGMVKVGKPFEFYNLINLYILDVICGE